MRKEETLPVAAIKEGIVIDHIPPQKLFKVVKLLQLEYAKTPITIGNNFSSNKLGSKGIIKIANQQLSEDLLNRIAILAPSVKLNIIQNYKVQSKREVSLPKEIVGVLSCTNEKCITNNEPMKTHFFTEMENGEQIVVCKYCSRKTALNKIDL